MSDNTETRETEATEPETNEPTTDATPEGPEPRQEESNDGAADRGTDNGSDELDAATLRKLLTEARKEAGNYRRKSKELSEALEAAASPEDVKAAKETAARLETELHRERLARQYGLPDALAARIAGDTPEAREEDAKTLASLIPTSPIGRGGLDPAKSAAPASPSDLAARIPRARH